MKSLVLKVTFTDEFGKFWCVDCGQDLGPSEGMHSEELKRFLISEGKQVLDHILDELVEIANYGAKGP